MTGAQEVAVAIRGSQDGRVHEGVLLRSDVRQARADGAEYGRDRGARGVVGPLPVAEVLASYAEDGHAPCVARVLARAFLSAALAALLCLRKRLPRLGAS